MDKIKEIIFKTKLTLMWTVWVGRIWTIAVYLFIFSIQLIYKNTILKQKVKNKRTTALLDIWQSDGVNQIKIKKNHIYV